MRLGLMGGTFDPIHNGHLKVARAAARHGLDGVTLVPARRPPHKDRDDITDPFHRFAMSALATVGEAKLSVSAHEVAREGPSYTIDTVRNFISSGAEVALIMGSDSLAEIDTWRECRSLLDLAGVIVYPRAPMTSAQLERRMPDWVRRKWEAGSILFIDGPPDDTASSEIRRMVREGKDVAGMLPASIAEYIVKHRLYVEELEGKT